MQLASIPVQPGCISACALLGIGEGDLVITTPFSFVSSTNVLLFERAVPIFVDVDPKTGNIDPLMVDRAVEDLTGSKTSARRWLPRRSVQEGAVLKAILSVDVFGQPADMDPIQKSADKAGLQIIEDACEALGAEYKGRKAGLLGDNAVFAFYPNKQITTGEGGMIVTDDDRAAELMRALRNQGRAPGDTWLSHTHMGYNYRLDEMSAALGRAQMLRLEELLLKRERVAGWYSERLAEISGVEAPQLAPETSRASWFVYVIRVAPELNRDRLAKQLEELGIPARPYFLPIHLQPYMVERFGYQPGDFPVTEELGRRGLALPFSSVMREEQVELVCSALAEAVSAQKT